MNQDFLILPNGFDPKYNIFKEDNIIKVRVEIPGHSDIHSDIEDGENYNIIKIKGKKIRDSKPEKIEDNIHNFREFGEFSLEIPVSKDYNFSKDVPSYKIEDGLYMIDYKLDRKKGPIHIVKKNNFDY